MNKLRKALEEGKAIHCKTEEEARILFEVMGFNGENCWEQYKHETCYDMNKTTIWSFCHKGYFEKHGKEIVSFSTLTQPNIITAFHAVGATWMEEGKEFHIGDLGNPAKVADGWIWIKYGENWYQADSCYWHRAFTEELKPCQVWSEQTIEDARAALRLGFETVRRRETNDVHLDAKCGYGAWLGCSSCTKFPELNPGQCVNLEEIVEG